MRDLAPIPADEFRALTLHDVVPAGHIAVPVLRDDWMPHLRPGEFAILDVSDAEPQPGELYGLMIGTMGTPVLKIVQPYRSRWEIGDAVMFRFGLPRPDRCSYVDGPLRRDAWFEKCRGRVVGVLAPVTMESIHGF